jgi:hypothetical protein
MLGDTLEYGTGTLPERVRELDSGQTLQGFDVLSIPAP